MRAIWTNGEAYELWMGRWNRPIAHQFVRWLNVPPDKSWLDAGCGTGVLTGMILGHGLPRLVVGVDKSECYVTYARQHLKDRRVQFAVEDVQDLKYAPNTFDIAVSSLVLNFVPDPGDMVSSLARVTCEGGIVACYVWDYLDGMELMRSFWDTATTLDPDVRDLPEVLRYPLCRPEPLADIFVAAGLQEVEVRGIESPAKFDNFDDYWRPFLGGQGTAPTYVASLPRERRDALRECLRGILPTEPTGHIELPLRAWAVRGLAPLSGDVNTSRFR